MKLTVFEMQQFVKDMFFAVINVCKKNNIKYYCQAGTVLGVVRHGGQIPWDHDVDIIIPENQIELFVECAKKDLPKAYCVDYFSTNKSGLRQFPRVGLNGYETDILHVDIFRLIGLPDDRDAQISCVKEMNQLSKYNALMRKNILFVLLKGGPKQFFVRLNNKYKYLQLFDENCKRYDFLSSNYVMNPSGKYKEKNIFNKDVYGEGIIKNYDGFPVVIPAKYDYYLHQYYGDYMVFPDDSYIKKEMGKVFIINEKQKQK